MKFCKDKIDKIQKVWEKKIPDNQPSSSDNSEEESDDDSQQNSEILEKLLNKFNREKKANAD